MGEGIRRKKGERRAVSLVGFDGPWDETWVEHLDHGLRQSFGQVGHPVAHIERPSGDLVLRHARCSFSYLWEPAKKETTNFWGPDLMFVSNLTAWVISRLLRLSLFLCSEFVFNMSEEARSWEPLLASRLILADWPRGQTPHLTPQHSPCHYTPPPSSWGLSLSIHDTAHLSGRGWIWNDPPLWERDTTDVWVSDLFSASIQHPGYFSLFCFSFWKWRAVVCEYT